MNPTIQLFHSLLTEESFRIMERFLHECQRTAGAEFMYYRIAICYKVSVSLLSVNSRSDVSFKEVGIT